MYYENMNRRPFLKAAALSPLSLALPGLALAKPEVPWDHRNLRFLYITRPGVQALITDVQTKIIDGLELYDEDRPTIATFYYLLYGEVYLYPYSEAPLDVAVATTEPKHTSNWVMMSCDPVLEPYYQRLTQDPGFDLDGSHTRRAMESHVEKGISHFTRGYRFLQGRNATR